MFFEPNNSCAVLNYVKIHFQCNTRDLVDPGYTRNFPVLTLPIPGDDGNNDLPGQDGPYNENDRKLIWWYHSDHLGSSTYLTDNFGRPSHYYETLPFGEMIVEHNQSSFYDNKYKFNGKELDDATQMYYYGARYYDPRISIFVSLDPLVEQTFEPYSYVGNNPIMFTDPTGMSKDGIYTDFVDIESGRITTINDGIDQTIALDGASISTMQEIFNLDKGAYSDKLSELSNSDLNLGLTKSQFMFFAESLYAESSGGFGESLGIVNVLENRAANEGTSVSDQLSASPPYGVYGVWKTSSGKNSKYKFSYMNEIGAYGSEQKRNNIHRAIAVGLTTTIDVSNGAYFWDGTDITTNSHYKVWGLKFSSPSHNLWGLKETSGSAQLKTTNAIGKTTFSKFLNQGKKWFISE